MKYILHAGIHKTATTSMQELLEAAKPRLNKSGIDYITLPELRNIGFADKHRRGRLRWRYWMARVRPRKYESMLSSLINTHSQTVVLSEEDVLGDASNILKTNFYPRASENLGQAVRMAAGCDLKICISVRNYTHLFSSAYCHCLKYDPSAKLALKELRNSIWKDEYPSFLDLFCRIQSKIGERKIHFWTTEDFVNSPKPILDQMTESKGSFENIKDIPNVASTRSPSRQAIEKLETLAENCKGDAYRQASRQIIEEDRVGERLMLFESSEIYKLNEWYKRDLDRLSSEFCRFES